MRKRESDVAPLKKLQTASLRIVVKPTILEEA
jgi:hypothetical protein